MTLVGNVDYLAKHPASAFSPPCSSSNVDDQSHHTKQNISNSTKNGALKVKDGTQ